MRKTSGMNRGSPSRESRDCQIEAAPEEMHGAGLADEARPEAIEHLRDQHQRAMKPVDGTAVIRSRTLVEGKRRRIRDLVRTTVIYRSCANRLQTFPEAPVKRCDRHRLAWQKRRRAPRTPHEASGL